MSRAERTTHRNMRPAKKLCLLNMAAKLFTNWFALRTHINRFRVIFCWNMYNEKPHQRCGCPACPPRKSAEGCCRTCLFIFEMLYTCTQDWENAHLKPNSNSKWGKSGKFPTTETQPKESATGNLPAVKNDSAHNCTWEYPGTVNTTVLDRTQEPETPQYGQVLQTK